MTRISTRTIWYSLSALMALLIAMGNIYVAKSVDDFGSPLLFALAVLFELILIIVFVYCLIRALRTPLIILWSILRSAWEGILTNPYIVRLRKTDSHISKWLMARIDARKPLGLYLTVGIVIALGFLMAFSNILQDVWFHEPLTQIDTRVINLMPSIRTPLQTSFFRFVTFTANLESIILLIALASVILWHKGQKVAVMVIAAAIVLEEGSAVVIKQLVGRMRPERALSLIKEDSFSFPSGHVLRATVIFGLLTYLIYRSYKSAAFRLTIVIAYIVSIVLVALSRVYLGVHYPSDVLASVIYGAALLTLFITSIEILARYKLCGQSAKSFGSKKLIIIPPVIIVVSLITSPFLIKLTPVTSPQTFATLSAVDSTTIKTLPHYSETLTGKTMEPISFIYIGSEQQIVDRFTSHGWYRADPSTLANTLKALSVGFQGQQYLNAPVTPSYLAAKPETLAFQKPTDANTLRQRHHTRLWRTDYKLADGREIWVATASYDEGIEFAGPAKLPTHHIDPNIDAERSYIVSSLGLSPISYLQVVDPQAGKNASGDIFFTDGRVVVVPL